MIKIFMENSRSITGVLYWRLHSFRRQLERKAFHPTPSQTSNLGISWKSAASFHPEQLALAAAGNHSTEIRVGIWAGQVAMRKTMVPDPQKNWTHFVKSIDTKSVNKVMRLIQYNSVLTFKLQIEFVPFKIVPLGGYTPPETFSLFVATLVVANRNRF